MATEHITKRGVLIVDPLPNMAALVATMLRGIGRRDIRESYTAQQAMAELRRRAFEVLVIDDHLADIDAVDFVRRLRASTDCQNRYIPIVMMAAAPGAARIAAARDAGVTEFLRKPFAASHLQSRLDNIEANPRGFIETGNYMGPDRRRRTVETGTERRALDKG
jgi:Response regulator containing a CheY-like receiver domain and a GGDEF domain